MGEGLRCLLMRGGTSKGAYFLRDDLPTDPAARDDLLMRVMGTPDARQIDGIGGGHPLTSKVAVVSPSDDDVADVDYLFLQVGVDEAFVTDRQNCGNLLAGVGPFAVERGLVPAGAAEVRIRMLNTGGIAIARSGDDDTVVVDFADTAGSTCGALFPTGNTHDTIGGVEATCIDNGMPTVVLAAADLGVTGRETPAQLEANERLVERLGEIRLAAGELMGMGDVSTTTVPKLTLVSAPIGDGALSTRTFIPARCHTSIGVLGAVTVATAAMLDGTVGHDLARLLTKGSTVRLEHPTGHFDVEVELDDAGGVRRAGVVRSARKLFDGTVFPRRSLA